AGREARIDARSHVLIVRERIAKLAADEIEVAIVVEVGDAGARLTIRIDGMVVGLQHLAFLIVDGLLIRARVLVKLHKAVQRTRGPIAVFIEGVIPSILSPISAGGDEIDE